VEDALRLSFWFMDTLAYKFRTACLGRKPIDPSNPPMAVRELVQSYKLTYLGGKAKVFNPYFRYFFQDPLVSLLYWLTFFRQMWRARKQLGR
jgi:hypothetical protein